MQNLLTRVTCYGLHIFIRTVYDNKGVTAIWLHWDWKEA